MARHLDSRQHRMAVHMIRSKWLSNPQISQIAKCSERSVTELRRKLRLYGTAKPHLVRAGRPPSITPLMLEALCDHLERFLPAWSRRCCFKRVSRVSQMIRSPSKVPIQGDSLTLRGLYCTHPTHPVPSSCRHHSFSCFTKEVKMPRQERVTGLAEQSWPTAARAGWFQDVPFLSHSPTS